MRKDVTGSYIWSFHEETRSEGKLAAALRKAGLKFGQEVPVKGFSVDFLVDEWLVVEVDGSSHLVSGRPEKDAARQKAIEDAGFTVLRIPADELSSEGDIKRWVKRIREKVAEGPAYLHQGGFSNEDYRRQLEKAKEALRIGEDIRKKRESSAFHLKGRERGTVGAPAGESEPQETMEDYFGDDAQDFGKLLNSQDWGRPGQKDDEDDEKAGRRGKRRVSDRRGRQRG